MSSQETASETGDERRIRLLYVEDNQQTGPLVREWLQRHDSRFEVSLTTSLADATDRLTDERFDAVVVDYRFPQGTGLDLVATARKQDPELPFLVYSGHIDTDIEQAAREADVTAVVQKGDATQLTRLAQHVITAVDSRPETTDVEIDAPEPTHDDFATVIHDIRGSLALAYGHLDLLDAEGEHAAGVATALTDIEEAVEELAAIVRDRSE